MPRQGKRRKLAKYIYSDRNGVSGIVWFRGHREELRFPSNTPIPEIRRTLQTRLDQLEAQAGDVPTKGTLGDVVRRYLETVAAGSRKDQREDLLLPWVEALGSKPFMYLQRSEMTAVTTKWRDDGLSASRANKRISALRVAWRALAPDAATAHAIERVTRYGEPAAQARGVSMELVDQIIDAVPRSASKARLRVLAWTGQPPALVMKIRPQDVRWKTTPPELYVSPRRKGTGTADAWLPLVPPAVTALRAFFDAKATGVFQTSAIARTLKRAIARVQSKAMKAGRRDDAARLDGFRLYDLRHSFASWFAGHTKDQWALAEYLRHTRIDTTARYIRAASSVRTAQAISILTGVLQNASPKKGGENRRERRKVGVKRRGAGQTTKFAPKPAPSGPRAPRRKR